MKTESQKLYGYRWQQFRKRFLKENPLCVFCEKQGLVKKADVVDHIIPHKGNRELFWREGNHQSLCWTHHQSVKQSMEKKLVEFGKDGWPIDRGGRKK